MKNKSFILVLFTFLLLIPSCTVFACNNSSKEKSEKSSCSKEDNQIEKKSCCDNGEKNNDGCGGTCDNSSCHCPNSVNAPVFFINVDLKLNNNFKPLINNWEYVQHNPKAIYLSIWQPPKIS